MANKLTPEERQHYKAVFDLFDEDHSGAIDLDELEKMVNNIQRRAINKADLAKMMQSVDVDNSGTIDFDEFLTLMTQIPADYDYETEVRNAFRQFDTDGSGTIDKEEITSLFSRLGIVATSAQIDDVIELVDKDGNKVIDFEEFKEMYEMLGMKDKPLAQDKKKGPGKKTVPKKAESVKGNKCCIVV